MAKYSLLSAIRFLPELQKTCRYMTLILTILFNLIIFFNIDSIIKRYGVYDYPDKHRKIHKKKISLAGGLIIFLNIYFIFLCYFFQSIQFEYLINVYFFFNKIRSELSYF